MKGESLSVRFEHLRSEWNVEKNGSLKFEEVSFGSHRRVWWKCKLGHEWIDAPKYRALKGGKCHFCSGHKVSNKNSISDLFPYLRLEWNNNKNIDLKFEDVSYGSGKKVWWICKLGHEWQATPKSRCSRQTGCPFCAGRRVSDLNSLSTKAPHLKFEWHPTKNGFLRLEEISFASNRNVWWKCLNGHEWIAMVNDRVRDASGCPFCSGHRVSSLNSIFDKFPELSLEWDFSKNVGFSPENVSLGSNKEVRWICKKGHSWSSMVSNRTSANRNGCPYCSKSHKHSKAEVEIFKIVQFSFPDSVNGQRRVLKTRSFELDVWVPSLRKAVEYNGQRYHTKPEQIERDARKARQCIDADIDLLVVTDTEYLANKTSTLIKIFKFLES